MIRCTSMLVSVWREFMLFYPNIICVRTEQVYPSSNRKYEAVATIFVDSIDVVSSIWWIARGKTLTWHIACILKFLVHWENLITVNVRCIVRVYMRSPRHWSRISFKHCTSLWQEIEPTKRNHDKIVCAFLNFLVLHVVKQQCNHKNSFKIRLKFV